MLNKSKTEKVTLRTTKSTNEQQTIFSSYYSASNGNSETSQYKSLITNDSKSINSGSKITETSVKERFGVPTNQQRGSAFDIEFGNGACNQHFSKQINTDAKKIFSAPQFTSTYSQHRPKPGGYCSPYRPNVLRNSEPPSKTANIYNPSEFAVSHVASEPSHFSSSSLPEKMAMRNPLIMSPKPAMSDARKLSGSIEEPVEDKVANGTIKAFTPPKTSKLRPGNVYIFNHEYFENGKEARIGTGKDVKALEKTFKGNFKMSTKVCNNFKVKDIEAEIAKIETKDFSKKACIVFVILTHGTRHDMVCAKDDIYSIDDVILFRILKNKTLCDKPKIFIIQACKGDYATNQYIYADANNPTLYAPLEIAKLYGTFEGFLSYRGEEVGSIFIQVLCENLQKSGKTKTVIEIMQDTIHQIVSEDQYKKRQVPTITHNMTKRFIFGDYA